MIEVHWEEFKQQAPGLAALGEERFGRTGLVLLGSLRRDGSPRISPVEPLIYSGKLYLGMMWQSRKALDLIRDNRCTVNSVVSDRHAGEGEFKVFGRAEEVKDLAEREGYSQVLYERIGFKPEEPEYHLFAIDIASASYAEVRDGEWHREFWSEDSRIPNRK
ncbi:MAG: pyridoxamine 5'-phosphate oxidase family protein [Dehalococcoidia bacterium]